MGRLWHSQEFRSLQPGKVQMDELFFYKFAVQKHERELELMRTQAQNVRRAKIKASGNSEEDLAAGPTPSLSH